VRRNYTKSKKMFAVIEKTQLSALIKVQLQKFRSLHAVCMKVIYCHSFVMCCEQHRQVNVNTV